MKKPRSRSKRRSNTQSPENVLRTAIQAATRLIASPVSSAESSGSLDSLLQYKWSRVIAICHAKDENDAAQVYDCCIDKQELKKKQKGGGEDEEEWRFQFCPEQFDEEMGLEQLQPEPLDVEEMRQYGLLATVARQDILTQAKKMEELLEGTAANQDLDYHEQLVKRLYRNVEGTAMKTRLQMNPDLFQYTCSRKGYKKRKSHELSVEEMVDMVHAVVVQKDYHADVADAFGVDVTLVH